MAERNHVIAVDCGMSGGAKEKEELAPEEFGPEKEETPGGEATPPGNAATSAIDNLVKKRTNA